MYASLDPATVWAEWEAGTRGAIDPSQEHRRLWKVEVRSLPVVDLRREDVVTELGISLEALTGPRARAHDLAARARSLGANGMVVPSAARDGGWNLVVFPDGFASVRTSGSRAMHPRPPAQGERRRSTSSR
jgi:RES domain-containing protein